MSDYLSNLAARTLNRAAVVRPRLAPLFGQTQYDAPAWPAEQQLEIDSPEPMERSEQPQLETALESRRSREPGLQSYKRESQAEGLFHQAPESAELVKEELQVLEIEQPRAAAAPEITEPLQPLAPEPRVSTISEPVRIEMALDPGDVDRRPADRGPAQPAPKPRQRAQVPDQAPRMAPPASVRSYIPVADGEIQERRTLPSQARTAGIPVRPQQMAIPTPQSPHATSIKSDFPPAPAPTIQVTIGRIEVRATAPAQPAKTERPASPRMSLEDYLRRRAHGGRT